MRSIFLKWTVIFFENKYFECWAAIMSVSFPNCKGRKSPPEKQEMHCLSLARIIVQSLPTRGSLIFNLVFLISSLGNDSYQGLKGSLIHKYFVKGGRVCLLLVLKVCIKVCISWEGHSLPLRMPLFLFTIKGWFTDPWCG